MKIQSFEEWKEALDKSIELYDSKQAKKQAVKYAIAEFNRKQSKKGELI